MALLLAMAGLAVAGAQAAPQVGRTLHYVRSNIDGGEEEHIYVHRAAPDRIAVYKMRQRCTNAAYVTAEIDPATGVATTLHAGRVARDGTQDRFGVMVWNPARRRLEIRVTVGGRTITDTVRGAGPWHLYDYDLATLMAASEARGASRAPMRFNLALVWPPAPKPLQWLGGVNARFVRAEQHLGRATLRFEARGPAFGTRAGGPIWIDARDGTIVDVQWSRPNHSEYRDFRLRLEGVAATDAAGWQALIRRHHEGCPAPAG